MVLMFNHKGINKEERLASVNEQGISRSAPTPGLAAVVYCLSNEIIIEN